MKLFLREHALLIIVQCIQFSLIVTVFWLAGFQDYLLALYSVCLGLFLLMVYLIYQYISRKSFYKRLSKPLESIDEILEKDGASPVYLGLYQLLKSSYMLYQSEIIERSKKQEEHLIFMDLWVHQMKTPLSVIDLTARDLDEPYSSNIRNENEKLKTGLNTVLYMSRLRAIHQDFHIKQLDLQAVVNNVNQENKRFFIRNRVYPQVIQNSEGLKVESDEKWLHFMVTQLVHNAVKYSTGKSERVVQSLYKRGMIPVLEIQDFGVGIPKSDLRRIFDAFYTGENGRIFKESTGVGLYVTKEVATYLGHSLEVESEEGKGTVIRIVFSKQPEGLSM